MADFAANSHCQILKPATYFRPGQHKCAQCNHFFVLFFLFLQSVSRRYLTDAHSWITASNFGIIAFNSFSSTTPSASVFAMLSSAAPTSFMRSDITWNSFPEVCFGSGILKATLPACDSRRSRGSKFFKSTQICGSSSAGIARLRVPV
jgi:hypothetical protein